MTISPGVVVALVRALQELHDDELLADRRSS